MRPRYARIRPLTESDVTSVLDWMEGKDTGGAVQALIAACADGDGSGLWILVHLDGGVVWGLVDDGDARLARSADPTWPPAPSRDRLQQLRVFGTAGELLVWRDEDIGTPAGRLIEDEEGGDKDPVWGWKDEHYVVAGTEIIRDAGISDDRFTAVREANGRAQVLPLRLEADDFALSGAPAGRGMHVVRLVVRHYLEENSENGCVRVAASRLVRLHKPTGGRYAAPMPGGAEEEP